MQRIIREEKKRPLSYEMLETLLPKWCRVTKYDSLKNVKTLKEALNGAQMLIVLYNLHDRISKKLINAPGHFVFPDQYIDRTTKRINTFFDGSDVRHVSMGEPFSSGMRSCLVEACN